MMYKPNNPDMSEDWDRFWNAYPDFDVVVTTYEKVIAWEDEFRAARWNVLVLDEGHLIKNEKSRRAEVLRGMFYIQSVMLTGTPIQCNLHELWALTNFLFPDIFKDPRRFDEAFAFGDPATDASVCPEERRRTWDFVHDLMQLCMLRRLKHDVEVLMPLKTETKIMCPLSACQTLMYKTLLKDNSTLLNEVGDMSGFRGSQWQHLQNLLMQLRKICNHPYILPGVDPTPGKVGKAFVAASGKFQLLDRLVTRLIGAGHRCLIFSQFTGTLDKIEDMLTWRGVCQCRLDGTVSQDNRKAVISAFNNPRSKQKVFLLTTRAGGLGLNLQTADTCIIFDSDWNPQQDLQAMARVHRIGQTKPVHVYRLVSQGTVEERLICRAEKRLFLDGIVLRDQLRNAPQSQAERIEEWRSIITFGADAIVKSDAVSTLSNAQLDAIIDRGRDSRASVGSVIEGGVALSAADFDIDADDDRGSIRTLHGTSYEKENKCQSSSTVAAKRSAKECFPEAQPPPKRFRRGLGL